MAGDGAVTMSLDALTPLDAELLLSRVLDRARLAAEPHAAAELAALCGYLPLPLRIAAAHLAARPRVSIGDLTALLRRDPLATRGESNDALAGIDEPGAFAIWRLHSFSLARAEVATNLIYPAAQRF
jgi:hypothetical protein